MLLETVFQISLSIAILFCTLVTGFILLFAIVVMPGFAALEDSDYLKAFQVIDRVIQNNQPLFIFIWIGAVIALVVATVLGFMQLEGLHPSLILVATLIYILGVQVPTFTINVPLNNRLQTLDIESLRARFR